MGNGDSRTIRLEYDEMIELRDNALVFSFPDVHENAVLEVDFERTLRIPDDGKDYPLPPGLERFPLRHVDDFARRVPESWLRHGGVLLPMYQSEALWLNFSPHYEGDWSAYPFAIKIATGKIDAVTGKPWTNGLNRKPQDYVVAPKQPWLDGYCVEEGVIRQFVAMPLGSGYSVEEQITGEAEHGGLQIIAYPLKREVYERKARRLARFAGPAVAYQLSAVGDMGLAPGGRMRQQIYKDSYSLADWDTAHSSRCFVHIANSLVWRSITSENPPTVAPTAREYTEAGLPWFNYYAADMEALSGASALAGIKSVAELGAEKADVPLPENESVTPEKVIEIRHGLRVGQVREGEF
jgi:hypothetical protein